MQLGQRKYALETKQGFAGCDQTGNPLPSVAAMVASLAGDFGQGRVWCSSTGASRYAISGLLFLSSFSDLVPYGNTPLCIYEPSRLDQAQGALQRSQRIPERPPAAWGDIAGPHPLLKTGARQ